MQKNKGKTQRELGPANMEQYNMSERGNRTTMDMSDSDGENKARSQKAPPTR